MMTNVQRVIKRMLGCTDPTCRHHVQMAASMEESILHQQKLDRNYQAALALARLVAKHVAHDPK